MFEWIIFKILMEIHAMNEALAQAQADLLAEVTDSKGKLASIKAYLDGLPDLVAAAVGEALAAANVEEIAAASAIQEAKQAISDSVDETIAAINANPTPDEPPAEPPAEPPVEEPPVEPAP